jgi:2-hydroxy-6-oxonona-2,4-dienedioate hydrolase
MTTGDEPTRGVTRNGLVYRTLGAGRPLLLLHGGSGSWLHWRRNLPVLAAKHRVIAFDLPGYGESPAVAADIPLEGYVGEVVGATRELVGETAEADIAGFSFGGLIATGLATTLGRRCRRLALIAPSGFEAPTGRVLGRKPRRAFSPDVQGHRDFLRHNLLSLMLNDDAAIGPDTIDWHAENLANARFDNRAISWSDQLLGYLGLLRSPLLLLYGEHDKTPYPSMAARVERCRAAQPDLELAVVAGAGHWAQYERPAETEALLNAFFDTPAVSSARQEARS